MAFQRIVDVCIILPLLLLPFMAKPTLEQEIFNPLDYEALGDGETDDAQALVDTWDAACEHHAPAIFLIPKQTFLAGPVRLDGPCRVTPVVQIQGTIKALSSVAPYINPGWIEFRHINDLQIGGGGIIDGQGGANWDTSSSGPESKMSKNLPISVRLLKVSNATVSNLTVVNSKGFHMNIQQSKGVTITALTITAPEESPNTDGIHISGSDSVSISGVTIGTGDDCISIGQGCTNILIKNVSCGPGHGISVGSLGKYQNESDVAGIHVKNCSLSGTTNGVRIKSWPGSPPSQASNIIFEDILMDNVSNPLIIDQKYCPSHNCITAPSQVKIQNVQFSRISGTSNGPLAVKLVCSETVPCDNVQLQDVNLVQTIDETSDETSTNTTSTCANVKGAASGIQNPASCFV